MNSMMNSIEAAEISEKDFEVLIKSANTHKLAIKTSAEADFNEKEEMSAEVEVTMSHNDITNSFYLMEALTLRTFDKIIKFVKPEMKYEYISDHLDRMRTYLMSQIENLEEKETLPLNFDTPDNMKEAIGSIMERFGER